MDGAPQSDLDAVRAAADTYSDAVYKAKADVFETLCHDAFQMTAIAGSGTPVIWTKSDYLDRVRAREPFPGDASYEILDIEVSGDIARVKLWVDVPPRRFEDFLGFFRVNGDWKLINKLFRTADGPALDG